MFRILFPYFMGVTAAVDTQHQVSRCCFQTPSREPRRQLQHGFGLVWPMNGDVPQVDEEVRGERWRLHPGCARQCVYKTEEGRRGAVW